ncbi:DUF7385 family protein [Salinigranum halophilum]|uniref:DUF7385 family protein n=1 Tax=Salinigranum halophilum TaxID=2565931 RepID=UPI00115F4C8A|nr:flagella cluster protein [Salinigranum halophilum]
MSFDEHAVRHRLKLVTDTGTSTLYENRDGVACPVCDDPFDEFYATSAAESFRPAQRVEFCVAHTTERLLLFTHETDRGD